MKCLTSPKAMQQCSRQWRLEGRDIALVPTMGALHEGHLSLIRVARRRLSGRGRVVVSLFVNPTQFGPSEDFSRYPRDLGRDRELCRQSRVDLLFRPSVAGMYPSGSRGASSTYVVEEELGCRMEGVARPTHFRGVTTVVAKLFNLVDPDLAIFGEKDYQQAAIIRRMIRDLNFPVRLVVAPTVREADGLALSSRNRYLTPSQRREAVVLHQVIVWARRQVRSARRALVSGKLKKRCRAMIEAVQGASLDYLEFVDPDTLRPVGQVRRGVRLALAVWMGRTRLIDNGRM